MQLPKSNNWSLWVTRRLPQTSTGDSRCELLQPGLCAHVQSRLSDSTGEWTTKRDSRGGGIRKTSRPGLCSHQGGLVIFCHLSQRCVDDFSPVIEGNTGQLNITQTHLDSCRFYFVPVSKPGAYVKGGAIPLNAHTARSLLFPGDQFQSAYKELNADGFRGNVAFQSQMEVPYRVTRATFAARFDELYANAAGWFDFKSFAHAEWQQRSDTLWTVQQWRKVCIILLHERGFHVTVCRTDAPCDILIGGLDSLSFDGTVRVELRTGKEWRQCLFESTKQARMWPEDGSERQLDMLIQLNWNLDESRWRQIVVAPYSSFTRNECSNTLVPVSVCRRLALTLPDPDSPSFDADLVAFRDQLKARVLEASHGSAGAPLTHLHAPNAHLLTHKDYLAASLNIDQSWLRDHTLLKRFSEFIREIKRCEPAAEQRAIPDVWPSDTVWNHAWHPAYSGPSVPQRWPRQQEGQPRRVCPSSVQRADGSYAFRASTPEAQAVVCSGEHSSGVEGLRCVESVGQTRHSSHSFARGYLWVHKDSDAVHKARYVNGRHQIWQARNLDSLSSHTRIWPRQQAGQPRRVCPSSYKVGDSYPHRMIDKEGKEVQCNGVHDMAKEGIDCMKATGQTDALRSFLIGRKWCNEDGTMHNCKHEEGRGGKRYPWKAKPAAAAASAQPQQADNAMEDYARKLSGRLRAS